MHTAHKDLLQTQYRPSRSGRGADPMDTVSLNGDCVRDAEGEEIGRIEGVMLDGSRDRIMYAILSIGRSPGGSGRLFAVPWSVLRVNSDEACVVLEISRERLQAAPGFGRDSWPSITDRSWRDEVDAYYDARLRHR
jgi:sporulation protein YlmC with PRC-barrel domain